MTPEELKRYNRHIILPEFGLERQEKLKKAKVLVIGAGGLGCPVLMYLTAAGIGQITIVDGDTIDITNLQRQVLFNHEDIGKYKAETAAAKLKKSNPFINIDFLNQNISRGNCIDIFLKHDIIIDGSDNFATRYLVNDACVITGKPLIFGSIFKFEGQVSVFNYQNGPSYRCVFPEPPAPNEVPSCSEIGVLGILPGIIGVMQASEALKVITGIGEPLSGKLLIYDALTNFQSIIKIHKNPEINITKLEDDYVAFCGLYTKVQKDESDELAPAEISKIITNQEVQIIDVREPWEYDICKIENAELIPLNTLPNNLQKIDRSLPKIVYCHHGIRSRNALEYLKQQGFTNLYNLSGGIDAWANDIEQEMEKY